MAASTAARSSEHRDLVQERICGAPVDEILTCPPPDSSYDRKDRTGCERPPALIFIAPAACGLRVEAFQIPALWQTGLGNPFHSFPVEDKSSADEGN